MASIIDLTSDTSDDESDKEGSKKRPIDVSSSSRKKKKTSLSSSDDEENNNNYGRKNDTYPVQKFDIFHTSRPINILEVAFKIKDKEKRNTYLSENIMSLKQTLKNTFLMLRKKVEHEKQQVKNKYRKTIQQLDFKIAVCMEIEKSVTAANIEADVSSKDALIIVTFNEKNDGLLYNFIITKGQEGYNYSVTYKASRFSVNVDSDSDVSESSESEYESYVSDSDEQPNEREAALAVLGLPRDAKEAQIRKQYHTLARQLHPDRNVRKTDEQKKENEERFKKIQNAFDILFNKLIKLKF